MKQFILDTLRHSRSALNDFMSHPSHIDYIDQSINLFVATLKKGGRIYSCGNGGSMCDAMHFAEELTGRFVKDRPPLPALCFSDPSHMSCVANDYGYQDIFSRGMEAFGREGDTLLAISTSGNSNNVIKAVEVAKRKAVKVVALLGKDGGKLKDMADIPIIVPSETTARIQEIHIKCIHIFIEGIERQLFPELWS